MGADTNTGSATVQTVIVDDAFWSPRISTAVEATIPHSLHQCLETGKMSNLRRAAGLESGPHQGRRHADSDLLKVTEGMAWRLAIGARDRDPELDQLIDMVAAAQEDDGYLYTIRTIAEKNGTVADLHPTDVGHQRWSELKESHELYDLGHLFEAGAAHAEGVGAPSPLLDIALAAAELVWTEFGPGGRIGPPGHQGIELGLIRLFDVTGDERWLTLCRRLLDLRGHHDQRAGYSAEYQDH